MTDDEFRRRLKRAADLLEAFAGSSPRSEEGRDKDHPTSHQAHEDADYVDLASGRIGVSGGASQPDMGAQDILRAAAVREVAKIRRLLSSHALNPKSMTRSRPERRRQDLAHHLSRD